MFFRSHKQGWVEIITGPMFSGKSTELIRRLDILHRSKENIQVFSPGIDDRYGKNNISNHNGMTWEAVDVKDSQELLSKITDESTVIVIDEIQFFDWGIVEVVEKLASEYKKRVIVAGLVADFRGAPFKNSMHIMARAEFVTKLASVCAVCHGPGTKVQRMTDGKPASANEPTINVAGSNKYHSRCRHCHDVPDYDFNKIYE